MSCSPTLFRLSPTKDVIIGTTLPETPPTIGPTVLFETPTVCESAESFGSSSFNSTSDDDVSSVGSDLSVYSELLPNRQPTKDPYYQPFSRNGRHGSSLMDPYMSGQRTDKRYLLRIYYSLRDFVHIMKLRQAVACNGYKEGEVCCRLHENNLLQNLFKAGFTEMAHVRASTFVVLEPNIDAIRQALPPLPEEYVGPRYPPNPIPDFSYDMYCTGSQEGAFCCSRHEIKYLKKLRSVEFLNTSRPTTPILRLFNFRYLAHGRGQSRDCVLAGSKHLMWKMLRDGPNSFHPDAFIARRFFWDLQPGARLESSKVIY
jgi:hypothetical protein